MTDTEWEAFERKRERSPFRMKFHLSAKDRAYIETKGLETIASHAGDFIRKRLAPAEPLNDGRQTPMRGHPVFIAQHATGCCCRGCLRKWHGIPEGRALTDAEISYITEVIMRWIVSEIPDTLRKPHGEVCYHEDYEKAGSDTRRKEN